MRRKIKIASAIIIMAAVIGAWAGGYLGKLTGIFSKSELDQQYRIQTVSNDPDTMIRTQVTKFGNELKNVSLLAPDAKNQIREKYSNYVTPELLTSWQAKPKNALGRNASSSWPENIAIISVTEQKDGTYKVEGNVVEIASADLMEPAAVYPITLTMKNTGRVWLISAVDKGSYSELPKRISVTGVWECLPPKKTSGPQTLECALGIKEDKTGKRYAVDTQTVSTTSVDFPTGTRLKTEGMLTPLKMLSSSVWDKYSIEGILLVTTITKI